MNRYPVTELTSAESTRHLGWIMTLLLREERDQWRSRYLANPPDSAQVWINRESRWLLVVPAEDHPLLTSDHPTPWKNWQHTLHPSVRISGFSWC